MIKVKILRKSRTLVMKVSIESKGSNSTIIWRNLVPLGCQGSFVILLYDTRMIWVIVYTYCSCFMINTLLEL